MSDNDNWKNDYSDRFDELRKHRVHMSHYKYGDVETNYKNGLIEAIPSCRKCIDLYIKTGNTEYLCDAANYLMFEFMFPSHDNAHFRATDSNESAGIVGMSVSELRNK